MLHALYPDGTLEWFCHRKRCEFHDHPLSARVDHTTVRYLQPPDARNDDLLIAGNAERGDYQVVTEETGIARGSVIALPRCICGSQAFLKADYTLDELLFEEALINYRGENGEDYGYILKIEHVRTMMLHHMLYHIRKAPSRPVLPLPSPSVLSRILNSEVEGMDIEVACSLWFTYALVGPERLLALTGFDRRLLIGK